MYRNKYCLCVLYTTLSTNVYVYVFGLFTILKNATEWHLLSSNLGWQRPKQTPSW